MRRLFLYFLVLSLFSGCSSTQKASSEFTALVAQFEGTFTSSTQASHNAFYENRVLRITPIWQEKGTYFLVEHALTDNQNQPFYVEVYQLVQQHNGINKKVYTLKNEQDWRENGQSKNAYLHLTELDIELKPGCDILIQRRPNGDFSGHTGFECVEVGNPKTTYSASGITLNRHSIRMWSEGLDKDGNNVYGSPKGGYIYDRQEF